MEMNGNINKGINLVELLLLNFSLLMIKAIN